MLGKEWVNGLVAHGRMQFVSAPIFPISIVRQFVILILKASNLVISWSELTEVGEPGVGVSEGGSADDVIMTIILFLILTLGVRMTAAMLEPVLRASGYALT